MADYLSVTLWSPLLRVQHCLAGGFAPSTSSS
jgi:hypothetical protein